MKSANTLQESKALLHRVIAGYEQAISENKTRRAYFIAQNNHEQAAKMEQAINRDEKDLAELKQQLNEMENELTPTTDTPETMNANETKAPKFSELSHTATNIVLTAENDGDIYRSHVAPLILSLTNKIKRGITPNRKRLAQSGAMRSIIAAAIAEMYCAGWMEGNTKITAAERKEAANYLAWSYISDAEDEYNNQMAAYK